MHLVKKTLDALRTGTGGRGVKYWGLYALEDKPLRWAGVMPP